MSAEPTNKARAARCGKALKRYGTDDTIRACLIDFLADARHWCDRSGEDYAALDRLAYDHYLTEIHEERSKS
jgi:hypothetical protein